MIRVPRRKRIPKRRILNDSPLKLNSIDSSADDSSDHTLVNTSSDQLRDESEPQLRIDINEPLVQPEFIVEELINFEPLHDVLADNINKIFNSISYNDNIEKNRDQNNSENGVIDNEIQKTGDENGEEIKISDDRVNDILANLETAPEFNTILDIITEKELQMTPYKNISSIETTSSSASSLNTPQTPQIRVNAQKAAENLKPVVKNLMSDLKTPEKTITLYAARTPTDRNRITPVKVTPVKVFRTDLASDLNIVINNKNVPIIVPKVSVIADDYSLIQNSITNSLVTLQSTSNSNVYQNANNTSVRRITANKRVDFSKPASELQAMRSELIPRKILPKPTTTTITPVINSEDIVHKQPLILVNTNNTAIDTNSIIVNQIDLESPKRQQKKDRKRPNSSPEEQSPVKIKVCLLVFYYY